MVSLQTMHVFLNVFLVLFHVINGNHFEDPSKYVHAPPNEYIPGVSKPIIVGAQEVDKPYPISASWFRDRFTLQEWTATLKDFAKIGGDTVWLRAPPIVIRSAADIKRDPAFHWCGSTNSSTGVQPPHCVDEAAHDLQSAGFVIDDFATYQYEEDFNFNLMICPKYDRVIHSSRVYYRLVLPVNSSSINPCNLVKGDHVLVLFTAFSGIDPHALLMQAAQPLNFSVYFGLPAAPRNPEGNFAEAYMQAYYGFVQRVLGAHKMKYDPSPKRNLGNKLNVFRMSQAKNGASKNSAWDSMIGYYGTDEACLATDLVPHDDKEVPIYIQMYKALGAIVRSMQKKFVLSPYILINKSFGSHSLEKHVDGLEALANTKVVDIIAVQEGRGAGKGCYYWPTEEHMKIVDRDPVLDKVIRYIDPSVPQNVTFREQFTTSNNMLFRGFSDKRDEMMQTAGIHFDLWLNVDAFEYLRDDPCLPVDPAGSGMAELLDRTTKERMDWAIAMADHRHQLHSEQKQSGLVLSGFFPQKIISFAWDSDFTCNSSFENKPLSEQLMSGSSIITNCSFHSAFNMSIVLVGFNMGGPFNVTYTVREGQTKTAELNGYYFEMDWGIEHGREPGLYYTQCWDSYDAYDIARKGVVRVQIEGQNTYCIFEYDYE